MTDTAPAAQRAYRINVIVQDVANGGMSSKTIIVTSLLADAGEVSAYLAKALKRQREVKAMPKEGGGS
jgi:hypothetical protein